MRCVKRRISDAIWRQLNLDLETDQAQDQSRPRWPSKRGFQPTYKSPPTLRRNGLPKQPKAVGV